MKRRRRSKGDRGTGAVLTFATRGSWESDTGESGVPLSSWGPWETGLSGPTGAAWQRRRDGTVSQHDTITQQYFEEYNCGGFISVPGCPGKPGSPSCPRCPGRPFSATVRPGSPLEPGGGDRGALARKPGSGLHSSECINVSFT